MEDYNPASARMGCTRGFSWNRQTRLEDGQGVVIYAARRQADRYQEFSLI